MTKPIFDIWIAISDSLELARKNPLRVFVWGLIMLLPILLIYAAMFPIMEPSFRDAMAGIEPAEPDAGQMMAMNAISGIMQIVYFVVSVPVIAAVGVAILGKTRSKEWMGLRLGRDELRVGLVYLAYVAGFMMALMLIGVVITLIGVAISLISKVLGITIGIVLGIVALVAVVWAVLRVVLIWPATIDRQEFSFVEGWKATKGLVWRLLGTAVIMWLVLIAINIATMVVVLIVGGLGILLLVAISGGDIANLPMSVGIVAGLIGGLILLIAHAFSFGLQIVMSVGPWYSVWQQLKERGHIAPVVVPQTVPEN